MFLLIKTGVCFESCGVNARSELVAKCEYKDVLGVVITQALRSAYETALAENDVSVLFNGYTIEEIEGMDEWLQAVERGDTLVIQRDISTGGTLDMEVVTYNIIEDKNYGGKHYE